jgi:hypothetical protein
MVHISLWYAWYSDNVNILAGIVHNLKEKAEALIVASKETGLEVNADKSEYLVMSRDQNAGRSHNINMITFPLKDGVVKIFGNNINTSKFYSGRN